MIESILGAFLGGGGLGGITGLIGTFLNARARAQEQAAQLEIMKQQHIATMQLQAADHKYQLELASMASASQDRIQQIQLEAKLAETSSSDFAVAHNSDKPTFTDPAKITNPWIAFMFGLVDFLRGLVRPVATFYMLALETLILYAVWSLYKEGKLPMDPALTAKWVQEVVFSSTYLITTILTYWFGVRSQSRK